MITREPRMEAVAMQMWERAATTMEATDDVRKRGERLFASTEAGLRRWIGAEGYASLLSRAVADVLPEHPALVTIPNVISDETEVSGSMEVDATDQQRAVIALLVAMMRQLGGIIGDNLAIRLIEQSGTPSLRGTAGDEHTDTVS